MRTNAHRLHWSGGMMLAAVVGLGLGAQSRDSTSERSEPFFTNATLTHIRIHLDEPALTALRLHPRIYVRATVAEGTLVYSNVGVHLKGQYGTFQGTDGKPSLTLKFDKFVRGQRFHGLDKLHLNNSVSDPSYLTELLCREPFRAAGVWLARYPD